MLVFARPPAPGLAAGVRPCARRTGSRARVVACSAEPPAVRPGFLRLHYHRPDGDYAGWGLHSWGAVAAETQWAMPQPTTDESGVFAYWDVELAGESGGTAQFIVHRGDTVEWKGEVQLSGESAPQAWAVAGVGGVWRAPPDLAALPRGDLTQACAFWLDTDVLATPLAGARHSFALHASAAARLALGADGVSGGDAPPLPLRVDPAGLPAHVVAKFPHLAGLTCLRLDATDERQRLQLLKCQLALAAHGEDGTPADATGVQTAGALDALCEYDGPLGCGRERDHFVLRVWAPTAQRVQLLLYAAAQGGEPDVLDMREGARGTWEASVPAARRAGSYYQYRVTAFHPSTGRIETCDVTDPYARALAANGTRCSLVCDADLSDASLLPDGWRTLGSRKPALHHPMDSVLYELHVRDFSVADATVPPAERGTFVAFARDSAGTRHLASLAAAGITHVHLLPVYDFGSVDERRERWREPATPDGQPLSNFPPDSEVQQAAVTAVADSDGYNWGYDPVHWGVPDGSYCLQPDGVSRTREFRTAVAALNALGLRVVVDVVYNHVYASGPASSHSVLDKLVPGYYTRRDGLGTVEASTCMNNTASEHAMCSRLIIDDVVHWATTYKVDGFRFDLMGHLMKRTMTRIRARLDALQLARDGVDGRSILCYGEGWDYAEVAHGRMGDNASQTLLAGTGIGTFNDRIREGAMGGGPFGDPRVQGLLTGLFTSPAPDVPQGTPEEQRDALARATERVLAGVAANLANYEFIGASGEVIAGRDAGWVGSRCGYAAEPQETVNYVSAHDNETLFDLVALKMYSTSSLAQRRRVVGLAQALLAWSQGIPFFHAGDELLRSKSLDRDSYNSGDHFNALDWTGARTGWGVGLPPASKNAPHWPLQRQLLADPSCAPSVADTAAAAAHFRQTLAVRASSPLFRLRSAADVSARLRMHNRGPDALPGVLVWEVRDGGKAGDAELYELDARFARLLVALNATQQAVTLEQPALRGPAWRLHPLLEASLSGAACRDGVLALPPLTAAVFVLHRVDVA